MSISINGNRVNNISMYVEKKTSKPEQEILNEDNLNIVVQPEEELNFTYKFDNGQMITASKSYDANTDKILIKVQRFDENGNQSETEIEPQKVDIRNATFEEYIALSLYLSEKKEYAGYKISDLGIDGNKADEKMDYLKLARECRDEEMRIGNMVGYHNSVMLCSALSNFWLEKIDKVDYIETDGKMQRAYMIDSGVENIDIGKGTVGKGDQAVHIHARWAKDSTVENPIVEVRLSSGEIYNVVIKDIDIENATQLEMFALCVYDDARVRGNNNYLYGESSYYLGSINGFFNANSAQEFIQVKQDWRERVESIIEQDKKHFTIEWYDKLYDIFKKYIEENVSEEPEEISEEQLKLLFVDRE